MKHFIILLLLIPTFTTAQRIVRNYDHPETGEKVLESTEEWLSKLGEVATIYYTIKKEGDANRIYIKFFPDGIGFGRMYTINPTDGLVITLENDCTVTVLADKVFKSCIDCVVLKDCSECITEFVSQNGRHASLSTHTLSASALAILREFDVKAVGMQTSDGFINQTIHKRRKDFLRTVLNYMNE